MGEARERVADEWDRVIAEWTGESYVFPPDLELWRQSYTGRGAGAVDLSCYPDPYVGDLRGVRSAVPRLVVLGLNPGVGQPALQGVDGVWTKVVKAQGYSRCFDRAPYGNAAWLAAQGKPSRYWQALVKFGRSWLRDPEMEVHDLLNFELYPFYSSRVTGRIQPHADVLRRYVWKPLSESGDAEMFAFGVDWHRACEANGMACLARYGPGELPLADATRGQWKVHVYETPAGRPLFVSWQAGNSNPPVTNLEELRRVVATH